MAKTDRIINQEQGERILVQLARIAGRHKLTPDPEASTERLITQEQGEKMIEELSAINSAAIIITTTTPELRGGTITITNALDSDVETATFDGDGRCVYYTQALTTYTFSATYAGETVTNTVKVEHMEEYSTTLNLWHNTIYVSPLSPGLYNQPFSIKSGNTTVATGKFGSSSGSVGVRVFNKQNAEVRVELSYNGHTYKSVKTATLSSYGASYSLDIRLYMVYGVDYTDPSGTSWGGFSRTDDAVDFVDPVPSYRTGTNTYSAGSSPFDSLMPWSGMERYTDSVAGEMVKIPKFYWKYSASGNNESYKILYTYEPFDVAGISASEWKVSPAHADRDDGYGERDVVYVGRYKAGNYNNTNPSYISKSGVEMCSMNMSDSFDSIVSKIKTLGSEYTAQDYAMYCTITLLWLVEFAGWGVYSKLGGGAGTSVGDPDYTGYDDANPTTSGRTDEMTYHTGTNAYWSGSGSKNNLGHIQYRYIEDYGKCSPEWINGAFWFGQKATVDQYNNWTYNPTKIYITNKISDMPLTKSNYSKGTYIRDIQPLVSESAAEIYGVRTSKYANGGKLGIFPDKLTDSKISYTNYLNIDTLYLIRCTRTTKDENDDWMMVFGANSYTTRNGNSFNFMFSLRYAAYPYSYNNVYYKPGLIRLMKLPNN